jgi:hypothetical protein
MTASWFAGDCMALPSHSGFIIVLHLLSCYCRKVCNALRIRLAAIGAFSFAAALSVTRVCTASVFLRIPVGFFKSWQLVQRNMVITRT